MGAPFGWQWIVVRNQTGKEMLDLVEGQLAVQEVFSNGDRHAAVQQGIAAYDNATTIPMWLAWLISFVVNKIGPQGLEYGRFSIDSHFIRNYLYVKRNYPQKLDAHIPEYAKKIVAQYKLPQK
jgi:3,8-divinyl protochlorophyllide a 8-vinyl-reductase (ferredoxin)